MMPSSSIRNLWVTFPKPNPQARLRLFCFPYAGGGASIFRTWPEMLPPQVELCAIQFPGRENRLRETPFRDLGLLIQTFLPELRPYLDAPFAFFGHSLGALVSFELSRFLRQGREPEPWQLFVSSFRAPQLADPDPPVHQLADEAFVSELRRLNGTPEQILENAELMAFMLPLLRADFALHETYRYQPETPLTQPISAFGGLQDPKIDRVQLTAWREQTSGGFELQLFPGDHFYLHSARSLLLPVIAQNLTRLLNRMDGK